MHRHFALSAHLRQMFGERVQKVPLDAGFDCPNRDGTLSRGGCVFCNPAGSGTGLLARGHDLAGQWRIMRENLRKRYKTKLFAAYLQSFSNTHGPIERLTDVLDRIADLDGVAALHVGTRPDCLDRAKLDLLAAQIGRNGIRAVHLDLGLQSADDATLAHINRGHTAGDFAQTTTLAAERGIRVCAHLMAGLPAPHCAENDREGTEALLATVAFVNGLPVSGVKFHNTYVCRDTPLAHDWEAGRYHPMTLAEYLHALGEGLMLLDPRTVVHRLHADPAPGELLAPDWAGERRAMHDAVRAHLETNDIWQGKNNGAQDGPPPWFAPEYTGEIG